MSNSIGGNSSCWRADGGGSAFIAHGTCPSPAMGLGHRTGRTHWVKHIEDRSEPSSASMTTASFCNMKERCSKNGAITFSRQHRRKKGSRWQ